MSDQSGVDVLAELVEGVDGLPAPIRRNLFKAIGQLCTAAVDVPIAYLEGWSAEIRTETEARLSIMQKTGKSITDDIMPPARYAELASDRFARKIVREQANLNKVALIALEDLRSAPVSEPDPRPNADSDQSRPEIADDWLSAFEREACEKSAEEVRIMFGRVLAEEIRRPSTFSIKTLRILGQLESGVARLFQSLCSRCVSLEANGTVVDARVCGLNGNAGANSLKDWGLHFGSLNTLQEYGLVVPDYNCYVDYGASVLRGREVHLPLRYAGNRWILMPKNPSDNKEIKIYGVSLSTSGKELFPIVERIDAGSYTAALRAFLESKGFEMQNIGGEA